MKNINQYIIEKFKISKDIKVSRDNIVDIIKNIIYDTLKNDFNLSEDDCRIGLCTKEDMVANNADESNAIRISLKKDNRMNKELHLDIISKLKNRLSEYNISLEKNKLDNHVYKIKIYF